MHKKSINLKSTSVGPETDTATVSVKFVTKPVLLKSCLV